MIITCPNCETRFKIDAAALAPRGKMVRCSQCGHRWFAEPPAEEPEPPPLPETPPVEGAAEDEAATARTSRPTAGTIVGWSLLVLVVLLLAAAMLARNEIVAAWPQATTLYRQLGLPVTLSLGLELRELASERFEENGVPMLRITAEIVNTARRERVLPPLRVALLDARGRELDFGLFDPPRRRLAPGAFARFEARLVDPPPAAERFTVTFLDRVAFGS